MITLTYILTFAAGPLAFWTLARHKPEQSYFAQLALLACALLVFAVVVPWGAGQSWLTWVYFGVVILTVLWVAWIVILSMCVLAVRRRTGDGPATRWAFAIGAIATTLPWFGLNLAQVVAD
ncbi:MAG: hypothetical protein AB8B82_08430 [Roseovarius sp.]